MHYRNWSADPWLPLPPQQGVVLVKTIPEGVPELLKPNFSKLDINKLKADIPKYPKAGIPRGKMMFWHTIGEHLQRIETKSRELPSGQWVLEKLQRRRMSHHEQNSPSTTATVLPEELISVRAKETAPLPEVYVGKLESKNRQAISAKNTQTTTTCKNKTQKHPTPNRKEPPSKRKRVTVTQQTQEGLLSSQVQEVDDLTGLQSGHLVALCTESLQDAPWIAQATGVEGDKVSIVWMEGDYNKQWKVAKYRVKGKLVEWTDCVDKCTIILYAFELTKADRLRKATVDALKSLYIECCS